MTLTRTRIAFGLAMLTVAALLLLSTRTDGASGAELAKSKGCGTYESSSIYPKGKVTAIRGVGCRRAREVAKKFDHTGTAIGKWKCGYGHGGTRLFSCGYGAGSGSLGGMPHALKVEGKR